LCYKIGFIHITMPPLRLISRILVNLILALSWVRHSNRLTSF